MVVFARAILGTDIATNKFMRATTVSHVNDHNFLSKAFTSVILIAVYLASSHVTAYENAPKIEVEKNQIFLDAHVHHRYFFQSGHEGFLRQNYAKHALLISESFSINLNQTDSRYTNLAVREKMDQAVSQIVLDNPTRFTGLCGVDLSSSDVVDTSKKCLDLPGIKGIKLRFEQHGENNLTQKKEQTNLRKILSNYENLIVLWHTNSLGFMNTNDLIVNKDLSETINVIKEFPNHIFIVAHCGGKLETLKYFSKHLGSSKNTYFELSTAFGRWQKYSLDSNGLIIYDIDEKIFSDELEIWRNLGIEKILFGTDLGYYNFEVKTDKKSTLRFLQNTPLLTDLEREEIFWRNGLKLILQINPKALE